MVRTLPALVAAIGAFLVSGAYYGILGTHLVKLSSAYAGARPSPARTAAVELTRSLVLAIVLAWLIASQGVAQLGLSLLLGLTLWAAFPRGSACRVCVP